MRTTLGIETVKLNQAKGTQMKATWHGATLAESDATVVVEGNHYFPANSIRPEYFSESDTHTTFRGKAKRVTTTSRLTAK